MMFIVLLSSMMFPQEPVWEDDGRVRLVYANGYHYVVTNERVQF